MKKFLASLLSRKFLLAVAALTTLAAARQWPEFVAALLGYLGVNTIGHAVNGEG